MTVARDIMTGGAECVGENGGVPGTATAGEFAEGKPVTIGADLVGMLSQADIARNYPEDRVGELVEFISY